MDKRAFYSQPHIVSRYDRLRFGSASGVRVSQRELALVASLLPPGGLVLDLACGTGRVLQRLESFGYRVVGLDGSAAMLATTRAGTDQPLVRSDAFALPFPSGTFDAVVALRLAFHFSDLRPLLAEAARILAPHGSLVFDTYRWSPRSRWALGRQQWGDRVYPHPDEAVLRLLRAQGLALQAQQPCFLFSPYLYRHLPLAAVDALERLETRVPPWALARSFWLAQAAREEAELPLAA